MRSARTKEREQPAERCVPSMTFLILLIFGMALLSGAFHSPRCLGQSKLENASGLVRYIDGREQKAEVVAIDTDTVFLLVEGKIEPVPFGKLDSIEFVPKSTAGSYVAQVRLVDDSTFNVDRLTLQQNELRIPISRETTAAINTRDVLGVIFNRDPKGDDEKSREAIITAKDRQGDALVVKRNGEFNAIEGIARAIGDGSIEFSVGDQTANVSLEKLEAVTFYHAVNREFEAAPVKCELSNGGLLQIRRCGLVDSKAVETTPESPSGTATNWKVTCLAGPTLLLNFSDLHRIQFGTGASVKLSDLTPATNDWKPLVASPVVLEPLRKLHLARVNESFSGEPLRLETIVRSPVESTTSKTYNTGFAMAGGGKLAFRLDQSFQRCRGLVGFDPEADENGNATLNIVGDGEELASIPLVKAQMDAPIAFDIEVSGCSRLVIEVDYRDGRSVGDQIHLVDLVLTK